MELIDVKNRVFPSLRGNANWDWFLKSVIEGTSKELFKVLYSNEQERTVSLNISKFTSHLHDLNSTTPADEFKFTGGRILLDDYELSGKGLYISYNPIMGEFNATETVNFTPVSGSNLIIIDLKAREIVHSLNIDTYKPFGENTNEDLITESCKFISDTINSYRNRNLVFVYYNIGGYSISSELSNTFSDIGVTVSEVQQATTDLLIIGNLTTSDGRNAYKFDSIREVSVPYKGISLYVVPQDNMISGIKLKTVASSGTIPDGPEFSIFPDIAETSELQPNLLLNMGIVFGNEEIYTEGYLKIDAVLPAEIKFGVLRNKTLLECSSIESAAILSTATGFPLVVKLNDSDHVVSFCNIVISAEEFNISKGKYISEYISDGAGHNIIQLDGQAKVHSVYSRILVSKLDYSPNNFKGLYNTLFGMKTMDVYSYTALSWLLKYCGKSIRDVEFGYNSEGSFTKEYHIRSTRFLSIDENTSTGYLYSDCPLIPMLGGIGDKVQGKAKYSYLAKIHDTDKLSILTAGRDLNLEILSYDKGIVNFSYSNPLEGQFIKEMLTKELVGDVSITIVRNLGSYGFDRLYSSILAPGEVAQNLIDRSVPLSRSIKTREWFLSVDHYLVKASKVGLIFEFSSIQVVGNDNFTIDLSQLEEWVTLEVGNGVVEDRLVTGKAPTWIKLRFTENETNNTRSGVIKLMGEHSKNIELKYFQGYKDYIDPWVNNQPYVEGIQYTFTTENNSNFNCVLHIRTLLEWEIEYSGANYMFVGESSGIGDRDVLISVPAFDYESLIPNVGYVTVRFKEGNEIIEYKNLIKVTQNIVTATNMSMDIRVKPQGEFDVKVPLTIDTHKDIVWMLVGCRGQQKVVFPYLNNATLYQSSWPGLFLTDRDKAAIAIEDEKIYPVYQPDLESTNYNKITVIKKDYGGSIKLTTPFVYSTILGQDFNDYQNLVTTSHVNLWKESGQGTIELVENTERIMFYSKDNPALEDIVKTDFLIRGYNRFDDSSTDYIIGRITVLEKGYLLGLIGYYINATSINSKIYLKSSTGTVIDITTWLYSIDTSSPDYELGLSPKYLGFKIKSAPGILLDTGDYFLYRKGNELGNVDVFAIQWQPEDYYNSSQKTWVIGDIPARVIVSGSEVKANTRIDVSTEVFEGFDVKSLRVLTTPDNMVVPEEYTPVIEANAVGTLKVVMTAKADVVDNTIALIGNGTGIITFVLSSETPLSISFYIKVALEAVKAEVLIDGIRDALCLGGGDLSYSRVLTPGNHSCRVVLGDVYMTGLGNGTYISDVLIEGETTKYLVSLEDGTFYMPNSDTEVEFIVEGNPAEPREYKEFPCFCKLPTEFNKFPWNVLSNVPVFGKGPASGFTEDGLGRINRPMFTDTLMVGRGLTEIKTLLANQYKNNFVQNEKVDGLAIYFMEFRLDSADKKERFEEVWSTILSKYEGFTVMKYGEISDDEQNLLNLLESLFIEEGRNIDDPGIKVLENNVKNPSEYNPENGDVLLGFFNV